MGPGLLLSGSTCVPLAEDGSATIVHQRGREGDSAGHGCTRRSCPLLLVWTEPGDSVQLRGRLGKVVQLDESAEPGHQQHKGSPAHPLKERDVSLFPGHRPVGSSGGQRLQGPGILRQLCLEGVAWILAPRCELRWQPRVSLFSLISGAGRPWGAAPLRLPPSDAAAQPPPQQVPGRMLPPAEELSKPLPCSENRPRPLGLAFFCPASVSSHSALLSLPRGPRSHPGRGE